MVVCEIHRTFAPSKQKKGNSYAFYRSRLSQSLLAHMAADSDYTELYLLSANPLALSFDRLMPRLELIKKYLPELEHMYTATRVSDIKNKTVEQLRQLKDIGVNEISLGVVSGDDWTLQRINKGYTSQDILEQCHRTFVEHLEIDCSFITHHTIAANLTGPHFLSRKQAILAALDDAIEHGDMDMMAAIRNNKRTL